jgi:hypothetical protein
VTDLQQDEVMTLFKSEATIGEDSDGCVLEGEVNHARGALVQDTVNTVAITAIQATAASIGTTIKAGIVPWTAESGGVTAADMANRIMDVTAQAAATADAPWLSPEEGLRQAWQLMAVHAVQESLDAARAKGRTALLAEADALRAQITYMVGGAR